MSAFAHDPANRRTLASGSRLTGGLLLAVAGPVLMRAGFDDDRERLLTAEIGLSILGTVIAVLVSFTIHRRMTVFCGLGPSALVIPGFAIAYGAVVCAYAALHLDCSHFHLGSSFMLAVTWFLVLGAVASRTFSPAPNAATGKLEPNAENTVRGLNRHAGSMKVKDVLDWIFALVGLVLFLPAGLLIAAAIKLDTPGPALFRQIRVGHRGALFTVYKFRTMAATTPLEDDHSAAMTRAGDQRITRVGRFLRRSRLDEVPQLLNVLRGEMSWVGPRPEALVLSNWYETQLPFYRHRHIVRPGITGWAQVNQGHVVQVDDVREKLRYDLYYVENCSLRLDMLIVLRTVHTVLTGFGAR